jgi:HK97 family phage portal protein
VKHGLQLTRDVNTYWRIYKENPIVNASINKIVQACNDYEFIPKNPDDNLTDLILEVEDDFAVVNQFDSFLAVAQYALKQTLVQGYAGIEFSIKPKNKKMPIALWNVENRIEPQLDKEKRVVTHFTHWLDDEKTESIKPEKLMWIRNPADRSLFGFSPLEAVFNEIVADEASSEFNTSYYQNPTHFGHIITVEGDDDKVDETAAKIEGKFTDGASSAFRNLYVGSKIDIKNPMLSNRDMENQMFVRNIADRIRMVYGVPPMVLGIVDTGKLANPEEQIRIFEMCVRNWEYPIEQAVNRYIMPHIAEGKLRFRFKHENTSLEKIKSEIELNMAKRDSVLVEAGVLTLNEARHNRTLEPIDGGDVSGYADEDGSNGDQ